MALLLLPILAFVAHLSPDNARPETEPVATSPLPSTPAVASAVSDDTMLDINIADQLQQEFSETLASLETRAIIPATEEELEAWARREYPADMWLYDLLREQYGYQGSWQHLLRESGEFLRFDYPIRLAQPNRRPSILALQRVAHVAGLTMVLDPTGELLLPNYAWAESPIANHRVSLHRDSGITRRSASLSPPACPDEYSTRLASDTELAESAVLYLLIAGCAAKGPVASLSGEWEAVLSGNQPTSLTPTSSCDCPSTFAIRLHILLAKRIELVKQMPQCSPLKASHEIDDEQDDLLR